MAMDLDFDVVDLGPADHPETGERAPDFTRPYVVEEFWEDRALSDLTASGPVLLVFHTMDGAFPTTYVWRALTERDLAGVQPVGLSISTPYEHAETLRRRDWAVEGLFSDPANGVAERYGIAHDLDGMRGIAEPRPAVFLVDGDREIRYAWAATEWPELPDYDAVEAAVADLDP
jgi:peroxiredoxin